MIGVFIAKKKIATAFDALNRRDVSTFISSWRDDCVFIYPGELSVSGKVEGKPLIEKWFINFMEQFPKVKFKLKNICIKNIFDFVGTNVVTVHWDVKLQNREGKEFQTSGVTVIKIKFGKALFVTEYIFDTSDKFKTAWGMV